MAAVKSGSKAQYADIDELDDRTLTEYLTVLEDQGRVRGCRDQYLVVSESGSEYLVDTRLEACECPDHAYRERRCKHLRRVAFAIGAEAVPVGFNPEDIAGDLREHVFGEPKCSE
ncbi:hypothetical protein [Natrinema sp. SYSU A 869]|uniref:hypothetical protein n=1 Tax=Natrinema sp. SYSU A 869 TaxID=2871694 RepID=UPI001CA404ED|nr:hypothetical protein [Natrinema sp. SYSU A 869]